MSKHALNKTTPKWVQYVLFAVLLVLAAIVYKGVSHASSDRSNLEQHNACVANNLSNNTNGNC
jgi:membrane protein implicated in regulation of membrane protease activity